MAYGDKKTRKYRGGGGSSYNWDADERRSSKESLDDVMSYPDVERFLLDKSGEELQRLRITTSKIDRYGDYDWNRIMAKISPKGKEGIIKKIDEYKEQLVESHKEQQEKRKVEQENYQKQVREQREQVVDGARLGIGYIQSEIVSAIAYRDSFGHDGGEWLDDPVSALTGQGGFGQEAKKKAGIKLQLNLCLDISNSNIYNKVAEVSTETIRTLHLQLDMIAKELPAGTLTVNLWTWAGMEDGKSVRHLNKYGNNDDDPRGVTKHLPENYVGYGGFHGEDTWIHPLLNSLEKWENKEGDADAYRLDLIISDGVLEHPTDIRKGDVIQERRDGNLQSVVLNFMPIAEWGDYKVPNRCVQYPVTPDTLFTTLRSVMGDWLVSTVL